MENKFYSKVFKWLFVGLLITFGSAIGVLAVPKIYVTIFSTSLYYLIFLLEIVFAVILSARIDNMKPLTAKLLYCGYALFTGITFASLFLVFKVTSIVYVFLVTAIVFGIFALLGKTTKINLRKFGTYLTIALISIILLELVNIFIASNSLDMFLCIISILIFVGYIAYDMQMIKNMAESGIDSDNYAIIGAFRLYLDFINIFVELLRLFGKEKD